MNFIEQIKQETKYAQEKKAQEELEKRLERQRVEAIYAAKLREELPGDLKYVREKIAEAASRGENSISIRYGRNLQSITFTLQNEGFKASWYEETIEHAGGVSDPSWDEEISGIRVSW